MTTLKSLTATLLLLIGAHVPAWAEGPAPLPFDSQGYSSDTTKSKPAVSSPTTPVVAIKEEPKKTAKESDDEEDTSTRVKQCEKVPAKKTKGKKSGHAKTVCKTVVVKSKASKAKSRNTRDEEEQKPICKKGKHCKASPSADDETADQPKCKKGKRCHKAEVAKSAEKESDKPQCKKGKKCKTAGNADEPKKKPAKHSSKKKK